MARRQLLRASKYLAGGSLAGSTCFYLWTRKTYFEPFSAIEDPFLEPLYRKFNTKNHPSADDCCVRDVPLSKLKPELLEDAKRGGSKLVEAYCGGLWGRYAFAIQRTLWKRYKNQASAQDCWNSAQLLQSTYEEGTVVADEFLVIKKQPTSILMRGGSSPRVPDEQRALDNLAELTVQIDQENNLARFKFKCSFWLGSGVKNAGVPLTGVPLWLHMQYARFLLESGVGNCTS